MKRTTILGLALLLVLGLASTVSAQTAQDLWPNQQGNTWTYVVQGNTNNGQKMDVTVTNRSGGWAKVEGFEGDRWWWMSGQTGRIWTWNSSTSRYTLVFDLSTAVGNTFRPKTDEMHCLHNSTWEIQDNQATVQTPVGTFNDCVIIRNVAPVCADAGLSTITFAPGVGIVEYGWTTIAGPHTAKLIRANVNGKTYDRVANSFQGPSVCLKLDKATYTLIENRMPVIGPSGPTQNPATLKARFEIRNDSDQTMTFDYRSGQRYDVIIRDDAGTKVYQWAANKMFTMALGRDTLSPGDALTFDVSFELRKTGNTGPLKEGNYTLEFVHWTTDENKRYRATVPFEIELQIVY